MHVRHRNKALCALPFILFSRSYGNKWSVTVALVRGGIASKTNSSQLGTTNCRLW